MTRLESFAPGEVIFFGEHSVVYGRLGLACSIGLGIRMRAERRSDGGFSMTSHLGRFEGRCAAGGLQAVQPAPELAPLGELTDLFFKKTGRSQALDIQIDSELPEQSGLASSAAVSSALIDLLSRAAAVPLTDAERVEWVYRGELAIQKRGSVIGSATTALGGWIAVRDGVWERRELPSAARIAVIDTQERCPTEVTTAIVKKRLESDRVGTEKAFDAMDALAQAGVAAIGSGDWREAGRCMTENQKWLKNLGVSTARIDRCLEAAAPFVLGAKITGAGGGGCLVCLLDPSAPAEASASLERAVSATGGRVLKTRLTPALSAAAAGGRS